MSISDASRSGSAFRLRPGWWQPSAVVLVVMLAMSVAVDSVPMSWLVNETALILGFALGLVPAIWGLYVMLAARMKRDRQARGKGSLLRLIAALVFCAAAMAYIAFVSGR